MDRYFVQLATEVGPGETTSGFVDDAFENESTVKVTGESESVPVDFELSISRITKARENGSVMLRFSGITIPERHTYVARQIGTEEPAVIQLDVTIPR